jgi:16S rRNA (cytosine1402-N4)-methyltransferase
LPKDISHQPVLVREVIEMMNLQKNGIYVDATLGPGGHAESILKLLGSDGKLIGIDRDEEAIAKAGTRLSDDRVILRKGNFSDVEEIIHKEGIPEIDGILFDFGVSTAQLKNPERGFSYASGSRLDMRLDKRREFSAWDIVNSYPEKELERILREYGEERLSRKIARAIVFRRSKKPIDSCTELSRIIEDVYRKRGRIHPATRTFQALRIEVNNELQEIRKGLEASVRLLKRGGRLCAISYHSLEDREVKIFVKKNSGNGLLKIITKKPLTPSLEEMKTNPSSRSAKLRAAEKT